MSYTDALFDVVIALGVLAVWAAVIVALCWFAARVDRRWARVAMYVLALVLAGGAVGAALALGNTVIMGGL